MAILPSDFECVEHELSIGFIPHLDKLTQRAKEPPTVFKRIQMKSAGKYPIGYVKTAVGSSVLRTRGLDNIFEIYNLATQKTHEIGNSKDLKVVGQSKNRILFKHISSGKYHVWDSQKETLYEKKYGDNATLLLNQEDEIVSVEYNRDCINIGSVYDNQTDVFGYFIDRLIPYCGICEYANSRFCIINGNNSSRNYFYRRGFHEPIHRGQYLPLRTGVFDATSKRLLNFYGQPLTEPLPFIIKGELDDGLFTVELQGSYLRDKLAFYNYTENTVYIADKIDDEMDIYIHMNGEWGVLTYGGELFTIGFTITESSSMKLDKWCLWDSSDRLYHEAMSKRAGNHRIEVLKEAVEMNNVDAILELATVYFEATEYEKTKEYLWFAATILKSPLAAYRLACVYKRAYNDEKMQKYWLYKAAYMGQSSALVDLADSYRKYNYITKGKNYIDFTMELYEKAIQLEFKNGKALSRLAEMYSDSNSSIQFRVYLRQHGDYSRKFPISKKDEKRHNEIAEILRDLAFDADGKTYEEMQREVSKYLHFFHFTYVPFRVRLCSRK